MLSSKAYFNFLIKKIYPLSQFLIHIPFKKSINYTQNVNEPSYHKLMLTTNSNTPSKTSLQPSLKQQNYKKVICNTNKFYIII